MEVESPRFAHHTMQNTLLAWKCILDCISASIPIGDAEIIIIIKPENLFLEDNLNGLLRNK